MASLECHSALEVSDDGRHRDVLLFVDPPYPSGIRTSVNYRHEIAAEADHRELAGALHRPGRASSCPVTTATCTASCAGWHRTEVATADRPGPGGGLALRLGRRARAWRGQRPGPKWPARRKPGLPATVIVLVTGRRAGGAAGQPDLRVTVRERRGVAGAHNGPARRSGLGSKPYCTQVVRLAASACPGCHCEYLTAAARIAGSSSRYVRSATSPGRPH